MCRYAIPLVLTASILAILIYNIAGMFVTGSPLLSVPIQSFVRIKRLRGVRV